MQQLLGARELSKQAVSADSIYILQLTQYTSAWRQMFNRDERELRTAALTTAVTQDYRQDATTGGSIRRQRSRAHVVVANGVADMARK